MVRNHQRSSKMAFRMNCGSTMIFVTKSLWMSFEPVGRIKPSSEFVTEIKPGNNCRIKSAPETIINQTLLTFS